ncbi:MAG: hypothetical protein M3472_08145 [Chloroflexota bacterium]|nr:hypothetical protein [Chloroflexota bacterium]
MDAGLFSAAWGRPVTESAFRCGVYLPPFGPCGDPAVLVDLAVRAEVAGWDGVFLWDHLVHEAMPIVDPWTALGAIAHATHRALGPHRQAQPLEDHPVTSSGSHGYGVGLASRRDGEVQRAIDRRRGREDARVGYDPTNAALYEIGDAYRLVRPGRRP